MSKYFFLFVFTLIIGGCASPFEEIASDNDNVITSQAIEQESGLSNYIGLTEEQAMEKAYQEGKPLRVIVRDGKELSTTDDIVLGRINATVKDGLVISYFFGD